jgi:hypothetical protein
MSQIYPQPSVDGLPRLLEQRDGQSHRRLWRIHFKPSLYRHCRCQFHQHFMYKFFAQMSFWQLFYIHVTREKLPKHRLYEKFVCKMLMKLTAAHCFCSSKLCQEGKTSLYCYNSLFCFCYLSPEK